MNNTDLEGNTPSADAPEALHAKTLTATSGTTRCLNCHTEFNGNYCPHCGQAAATQRFTLRNVLASTLEVWGIGNRSLPRTLYHLFTRPGKMIGDYLDGKRMPFFPPVKMLFILCIFFAIVSSFETEPEPTEQTNTSLTTEIKVSEGYRIIRQTTLIDFGVGKITVEHTLNAFSDSCEWLDSHKGVALICLHLFFTLFSWRVFRKSPVRPRSTLSEHFFAQVMISSQMVALSIPYMLIFGYDGGTIFYPLPGWLLLVLFTWDFKQLFGYTWGKTIWRTLLIHLYTLLLFILLCTLVICTLSYFAYQAGIFEKLG
ncbi:MAG: DUF3667 domain-containing protein [Alloprevotella sp.]